MIGKQVNRWGGRVSVCVRKWVMLFDWNTLGWVRQTHTHIKKKWFSGWHTHVYARDKYPHTPECSLGVSGEWDERSQNNNTGAYRTRARWSGRLRLVEWHTHESVRVSVCALCFPPFQRNEGGAKLRLIEHIHTHLVLDICFVSSTQQVTRIAS
jgi:hypothetical protein